MRLFLLFQNVTESLHNSRVWPELGAAAIDFGRGHMPEWMPDMQRDGVHHMLLLLLHHGRRRVSGPLVFELHSPADVVSKASIAPLPVCAAFCCCLTLMLQCNVQLAGIILHGTARFAKAPATRAQVRICHGTLFDLCVRSVYDAIS